jgi:hypothetical protein
MKKFFTLFLAVFLFAGILNAQRNIPSAGPAPESKETNIIEGSNLTLVSTQRAFAVNLIGTTGPAKFWLNAPGTLTNLSPVNRSIFGADFNGTGVWYGVDYATNELVTIDTTNGAYTVVGPCSPGAVNAWTGMSWDRTSNTMYGSAFISGSSVLVTIDLSTGAVTPVGTIGAYIVIDIAINNAGQIYGFEISTDNIITINKTTGAGTILGPSGLAANYAQGMSFDPNTDELFLAGYTASAALYQVNTSTGATTLIGAFPTGSEVDAFTIPGGFGAPCPVGQASNPSPADNAVDLPRTGVQLTWTSPANANAMELYFGTDPGALAMVYSGPLVTSYNVPGVLSYFTKYYWRVKGKNDTCAVNGPMWNFKTLQDPNLYFALVDDFSAGTGNWTITNDGGTCVWVVYNTPYPNAYTLPATSAAPVFAADADECGSGSTLLSTATLTNGLNFTMYQTVMLEFDSDWNAIDADDQAIVDVSNDGGTTWVNYMTYGSTDVRNETKIIDISATAALYSNVKVRFKSIQPGWDWWWAIDNVKIIASNIVPVELASFRADVNGNTVSLNWMTATETNNSGFEVERSVNGAEFQKVGYVSGNGTTTETKAYSFVDSKLANGKYSYRLKQVDLDGTFEYSKSIEVDVNTPMEYSLDQNYPNPFNPSTKISFTLAADSKVDLKVFNILGQEIAVIVNGALAAGSHSYNFDASNLNSGVYFYQFEAQGADGSSFKSIKKMMLTK